MKILLLEDRITRQTNFLNKSKNQRLEDFADILDNILGDEFQGILDEFTRGNYSFVEKYDCLLLHRSAFTKEIKSEIFNHCKKKSKPLVYFSGGISSSFLEEVRDFSFLTINSKDFYSNNLILFLNNIRSQDIINLGLLAFGPQWELNLLLSLRQKLILNDGNTSLGDLTSVLEIIEWFQINSGYLKNLFDKKLPWFESNWEGISTITAINDLNKVVTTEIKSKIYFE